MTLDELQQHDRFAILILHSKGEIRRRLIDMGFVRGAQGVVLRKALLGGPIEVRMGRTLLSLRASEAVRVEVEKVPPGKSSDETTA